VEHLDHLPYLLVHTSKGKRRQVLVERSYWTIGRSKENDIPIPDRCISRYHAILQIGATGEFNLIDLGSRNGTFVNERRTVVPVMLQDGDAINFGNSSVEFHCPKHLPPPDLPLTAGDPESTAFLHKRRSISVVVVDIRDFTLLARQMDDDALARLIGNWFRQAGDIIRDAGSWVYKYIGDAVMAVWFHGEAGADKTLQVNEAELRQIFQAVSSLDQMTRQMNLNSQYSLPFPLRIGVGINTGLAMVGNTGSGDRPDYTAIGDTVNAAFRLESATKEIAVDLVIGATTYEHLHKLEAAREIFRQYTVSLKGYGTATTVYGTTFDELDRFLAPPELIAEELLPEDSSTEL
jgi:adenylate cyclase